MRAVLSCVLLVVVGVPRAALAHGLDTAYLELSEAQAGRATLSWRPPSAATRARPKVPVGCDLGSSDLGQRTWVLRCAGGLSGRQIEVEGLGAVVTNVVVRVSLADGSAHSAILSPAAPSWRVPRNEAAASTVIEYVPLGLRHILGGLDHLMFLLALVLALRNLRGVLLAETAFTLSHMISFTITSVGWLSVPAAPVEVLIALSLTLAARDLVRGSDVDGEPTRTAVVALVFGAVHGLGFAGGLRELGVPPVDVPAALLGFGAGVELAQLSFVVVAWALVTRAGALLPSVRRVAGVTMGVASAYWLFERAAQLV